MDDILKASKKFWFSAGRTGLAHYRAAVLAEARNKQIGLPNVAISAVVATSIFSTLSESVDVRWRIATGVIALVAAILAALQAFLKYGDEAEKHKASGAKYGDVRRKIDLFQLEFSGAQQTDRDAALQGLKEIADELNSLDTDSPTLTDNVYNKAKKEFEQSHSPSEI